VFESYLAAERRTGALRRSGAAAVSAALLLSPVLALAPAASQAAARSSTTQPRARHADGTILRRGDVNATVARVQRALGIPVDRIFGPLTRRAVADFQSAAGLPRTGKVDGPTWRALFRAARSASPPAPAAAAGPCGGRMTMPVDGTRMSAFGGVRNHAGIDIAAPVGTAVRAAGCGTVMLAGRQSGYGKMVCVDHGAALSTCYAHLSSIAAAEGASVTAGQVIGRVGMTGRTSGPHLHFETRRDGRPQDPAPYLAGSRTMPAVPAR